MDAYALLFASTLSAGTVLALAALGLLINEKAGVINLGAEGMMLCAALAGFAAVVHTGSTLVGFLAGMGAGALLAAGLRAAPPPEDWLTKLYDGEVLVDLIHRPNYRAVTDDLLDRAALMRVGPTSALVIGATDLMVDKLMVLDAHRLDFATLLQIARGLREQVDWPEVTARTETSPYARAFLSLVADLGITSVSRTGFPDDVLPEYLEAHARRALAEDAHTAELGVHVAVVGGRLCLHGEVGSDGARSALESVLHEHLPSVPVRNQVTVTDLSEPDHSETIG